ncbi:MAG TPA: hypothetical protein VGI18_03455 [Burkholderiales bacterium]|jgi:hypothetical protein
MKTIFAFLAAATLIAACERPAQPKTDAAASGATSPTQPLPQTSASRPGATAEEKKESANPQQGQVDPKDGAQHRDFQQSGDGAGPASPDAKPKGG